jgi:arginase
MTAGRVDSAVAPVWGLLGVPSSAAAHWPGIEKAPAALRAAGILDVLRAEGISVTDHGDLPVARWRSHRPDQRPNDSTRVAEGLREIDSAVCAIFNDGHRPLLLGGECTVVVGVMSALARRGVDTGLIYVDGGQDLMIPRDHPSEPILDGMGVAHLLDLPGVVDEIAGVGPRRPLLTPSRLAFVGFADEEEDIHGLVPSARFPASVTAVDPIGTASAAIEAVTAAAASFVVHVDLDVLDFLDTPAADVPNYGRGLTLAQLVPLLGALVNDRRCAAMTFVEHNPEHGEPDGSTTAALVHALARALAGSSD